jgi:hypothetical protein
MADSSQQLLDLLRGSAVQPSAPAQTQSVKPQSALDMLFQSFGRPQPAVSSTAAPPSGISPPSASASNSAASLLAALNGKAQAVSTTERQPKQPSPAQSDADRLLSLLQTPRSPPASSAQKPDQTPPNAFNQTTSFADQGRLLLEQLTSGHPAVTETAQVAGNGQTGEPVAFQTCVSLPLSLFRDAQLCGSCVHIHRLRAFASVLSFFVSLSLTLSLARWFSSLYDRLSYLAPALWSLCCSLLRMIVGFPPVGFWATIYVRATVCALIPLNLSVPTSLRLPLGMCLGLVKMFRPRESSPLVHPWHPFLRRGSPVQEKAPSQAPVQEKPVSAAAPGPELPISPVSRAAASSAGKGREQITSPGRAATKSPFDFVSPFDVLDQVSKKEGSRPASHPLTPPQPSELPASTAFRASQPVTTNELSSSSAISLSAPSTRPPILDSALHGSDESLPDPITAQASTAPRSSVSMQREPSHEHHHSGSSVASLSAVVSTDTSAEASRAVSNESTSKVTSESFKSTASHWATSASQRGSRSVALVNFLFQLNRVAYVLIDITCEAPRRPVQ